MAERSTAGSRGIVRRGAFQGVRNEAFGTEKVMVAFNDLEVRAGDIIGE